MTKKRASSKKEKPKAATEPKPAAPAASAAPRPNEDRLALRFAVLEDVVKRNAQELGRRLADVERRVTPS